MTPDLVNEELKKLKTTEILHEKDQRIDTDGRDGPRPLGLNEDALMLDEYYNNSRR